MANPIETVTSPMTGNIEAIVRDPNGVNPVNIIRTTDAWVVEVKWTLTGEGARFVSPNERWLLRVFVESIGPGFELPLQPPAVINALGGANQEYKHVFTFPANPNMALPHFSGVYKIMVVLTLTDANGNRLPIAGFHEGPMVQFYVPN